MKTKTYQQKRISKKLPLISAMFFIGAKGNISKWNSKKKYFRKVIAFLIPSIIGLHYYIKNKK